MEKRPAVVPDSRADPFIFVLTVSGAGIQLLLQLDAGFRRYDVAFVFVMITWYQ